MFMLYVHAQDTTLISVHVHAQTHLDSRHVLTDLQKTKTAHARHTSTYTVSKQLREPFSAHIDKSK